MHKNAKADSCSTHGTDAQHVQKAGWKSGLTLKVRPYTNNKQVKNYIASAYVRSLEARRAERIELNSHDGIHSHQAQPLSVRENYIRTNIIKKLSGFAQLKFTSQSSAHL